MQSSERVTVVLGTGGTIAGTADSAARGGYKAGQIGIADLVASNPALASMPIESEQIAQVDSKDMDFAVWQRIVRRVAHHLGRDEVGGIVVTHGTDTLEETAYLLQRVLAPSKPVAMTASMRPATSLLRDGPQNLLDAVTVARAPGATGVTVVMAGTAWSALGVRKSHTRRLDAFDAGDAGPIARIEPGGVHRFRDWPAGPALGVGRIEREPAQWPRVEIVMNHAGADGRIVHALLAQGVRGIVLAGTGHGTVGAALEQALDEARAKGVRVRISTRCAAGPLAVAGDGETSPAAFADDITAVQARIELLLELLAT